jgi:hypothetical protein
MPGARAGRADRWWALVWLGLVFEGVALHLTGWLSAVVIWAGAIQVGTVIEVCSATDTTTTTGIFKCRDKNRSATLTVTELGVMVP